MGESFILKKILCFVLVLVMLAAAEAEFQFEESVTWSSAPDDVMALLDSAERSDETAEPVGTLTTIIDDATEYDGLECGRKLFMFYNDELFMITCYFTKAQLGDTQVLIDALIEDYGEPVVYTEADRTDEDWMNGVMTRCHWGIDENTDIYVIQCQDVDAEGSGSGNGSYPYLCYVGFENPVVYEKMNAAIAAAFGQ